jgi:hypothetical protein
MYLYNVTNYVLITAVAVALMARHLVVYVATPHPLALVTVAISRELV